MDEPLNLRAALVAAKACAESLGLNTILLSSCMEGEAREVGGLLATIGKEAGLSGRPVVLSACVLAGGETTVPLGGGGAREGAPRKSCSGFALRI
jgi:glycerate 2-kinase